MQKKIFCKEHLLIIIAILIFPVLSFADADKIFKENSKAVVVVVTLNEKGEPKGTGWSPIIFQLRILLSVYGKFGAPDSVLVYDTDSVHKL